MAIFAYMRFIKKWARSLLSESLRNISHVSSKRHNFVITAGKCLSLIVGKSGSSIIMAELSGKESVHGLRPVVWLFIKMTNEGKKACATALTRAACREAARALPQ